jgi:signal transduction histidine kinase
MNPRPTRLALPVFVAGVLLVAIFVGAVVRFRSTLREEIHQTIIRRDAAALYPVALRQLADQEPLSATSANLLPAVLESAQQENMLAIAVFDEKAEPIDFAPRSLLFAELPLDDYLRLLKLETISRYHADFPLARYFAGVTAGQTAPVLEVLLPLHAGDPQNILGFAQYYIDARPLAAELALTDRRIRRQTFATLVIGTALICAVLLAAYFALRRAQAIIAERNDALVRANFELTLAAKVSALGQIASHLIHGLQGPVAGLRAVVSGREARASDGTDWETAASYTDRMQALIQDTVAMLGDQSALSSYQLTGHELADIVRRRNAPAAEKKGVRLDVTGGFDSSLDNHRGGVLCLIISNLVDNALHATGAGRTVSVLFRHSGAGATVLVSDEGGGISPALRPHLFEPGRSGREGGSGLGLAISQLLARQIGATLTLETTGPDGTVFRLALPLETGQPAAGTN